MCCKPTSRISKTSLTECLRTCRHIKLLYWISKCWSDKSMIKKDMLEISWINSINICLILIWHRYTTCEYFMGSVNCPLCDILHSLFPSPICWFQLVTCFLYFFGWICCPNHAIKRVKKLKIKRPTIVCSGTPYCFWWPLWTCQKKLLRSMK